jgi:hypothetical protein
MPKWYKGITSDCHSGNEVSTTSLGLVRLVLSVSIPGRDPGGLSSNLKWHPLKLRLRENAASVLGLLCPNEYSLNSSP